jgi:hypothetical protein
VILATVLLTRSAAWAQPPAATSVLPIGSPLTIISEETVDPRVRPGSEFRAHLRDPLTLGDTLVATAGTRARLVVTSKVLSKDGTPSFHIAVVGLDLGLAGTLPVRPNTPTVEQIKAGMAIPATTLAALAFVAGKVRVALPLPFKLSNEPPNGGYTPAPLRTASPIINNNRNNRRHPTPSPSPSASPSAPAASAPAGPTPNASPQLPAQPGASSTP